MYTVLWVDYMRKKKKLTNLLQALLLQPLGCWHKMPFKHSQKEEQPEGDGPRSGPWIIQVRLEDPTSLLWQPWILVILLMQNIPPITVLQIALQRWRLCGVIIVIAWHWGINVGRERERKREIVMNSKNKSTYLWNKCAGRRSRANLWKRPSWSRIPAAGMPQ